MIADEKVGAKGVKVRCKKCGNIISVTREEAAPAAQPAAPQASAFDDIFGNAGGGAPDGEERAPTKVFTTNELEKVRQEKALATGEQPAAPEAQAPAPQQQMEQPAAQASRVAEWYVAINDEQVGPITLDDVQVRWDRGDLNGTSLAWKAGLADWAAIASIPELAALAARQQAAKEAPKPAVVEQPRVEEKKEVVTWRPSGASALADLAKEATIEEPKKVEAPPPESPFGMDFNPPSQGGGDPFGGGPAFAGAAAAGPSTVWQFPTSTAKKSNSGTPKWLLGIVAFTMLALVGVVTLFALGVLPPKQPQQQIAALTPPPVPPPVAPVPVAPSGQVAPTAAVAPAPTPTPTGVQPVQPGGKKDKTGKKGKTEETSGGDEAKPPPEPKEKEQPKGKKGKDGFDDLLEGKSGGSKGDVKPTLDRNDVLSTVKNNLGSIKACADAYSRSGGKLPPKLIAKWIIKPSGFTDQQEMTSPELKGTPVDGCVVTAIKKWRFPEFASGAIPVTFPFPLGQ